MSQLCPDHEDAKYQDRALWQGSWIESKAFAFNSSPDGTRAFHDPHEAIIPARAIRPYKARYHDGGKMMDYYVVLHRALFCIVYGLDLCFIPTVSTGTMSEFFADMFALSKFYGMDGVIGTYVQKVLWEDAGIATDICQEPAFYIALADELNCRQLLLETIKHAAGKEMAKGGESYCGSDPAAVSDKNKSLIRLAQEQMHANLVEVYDIIMNAIIMPREQQVRTYLEMPSNYDININPYNNVAAPISVWMQVRSTVASAIHCLAQYIPNSAISRDLQWQRACTIAQAVVLKEVAQRLWRPTHDSRYLPQEADAEFLYNLTQNNCWFEASLFPVDVLKEIAATHRIAPDLLSRAIGHMLGCIDCAHGELAVWRFVKKYMQEDDRDWLDYNLTNFRQWHEGPESHDAAFEILGWWDPMRMYLQWEQDMDAVARAEHEIADHFASLDLLRGSTIEHQPFESWRSVMGYRH